MTPEEQTWRNPALQRPSCVPIEAVPLMWEGVVYGDYWITPKGEVFKKTGEHMKEHPHHTGYPRVSVIKNGKSTSLNVHNLVAYTFKPIPSKLIPAIDHVDVDKTNHDLHNLEFTGQAENTRRAYQEGANKSSKPVAALDNEGNVLIAFYSRKAAEEFMANMGKSTRVSLRSVLSGTSRRKKAYGLKWCSLEWEAYEELTTDPGTLVMYTNDDARLLITKIGDDCLDEFVCGWRTHVSTERKAEAEG